MQIIFQDPYASLDPRMTVGAIVGEALVIHKLTKTPAEYRERIVELLETVGLNPTTCGRYPHEFSGGPAAADRHRPRARRVAEADRLRRAGVGARRVDPGAGDQPARGSAAEVQPDVSVHRARPVGGRAHQRSRRRDVPGRIVEIAPRAELYTIAAHPYTEALLSAVPIPEPGLKRTRIRLTGDVPNPINPPSGCHFHPRCPKAFDRCKVEDPLLKQVGAKHWAACHLNDALAVSISDRSNSASR
jgi:oligopeptide transport system ATP-binding protein